MLKKSNGLYYKDIVGNKINILASIEVMTFHNILEYHK